MLYDTAWYSEKSMKDHLALQLMEALFPEIPAEERDLKFFDAKGNPCDNIGNPLDHDGNPIIPSSNPVDLEEHHQDSQGSVHDDARVSEDVAVIISQQPN